MTAVIILAAGASTRLAQPKQNLIFKERTLLQTAIAHALQVSKQVIVVLGANADIIRPTLAGAPITVLRNDEWNEGMASSIRLGVEYSAKSDDVNDFLLMLCDQPFADGRILRQLLTEKQSSAKGIVASAYRNTLGAPVLFDARYKEELLALIGHDGAKKLLGQFPDDVTSISFPLGEADIDTMDDYHKYNF